MKSGRVAERSSGERTIMKGIKGLFLFFPFTLLTEGSETTPQGQHSGNNWHGFCLRNLSRLFSKHSPIPSTNRDFL